MEFFDKIGRKASEAYKVTADKTGKIAKEAKLKMKMAELKSQVNDIYKEIGKKVYEKHIREENIDIKKDLEEECTKIDVLSAEIESNLKECLDLKDRKQCQKCFKEIDKNMNFCPECGAKQEEEPAREVEIVDRLENIDIKPAEEKTTENQKVEANQGEEENNNKEDEEENNSEKTNLEKTVQVESDVEAKDVEAKTDEQSKEKLEKTVEVESNVEMSLDAEQDKKPEE